MRDAGEIQIDCGVVHVLDHLAKSEPVLSQAELSLQSDATLSSYFAHQIQNALADPSATDARFVGPATNGVAQQCHAMLGDRGGFLQGSQDLARLLFTAMRKDRRIKPGSLAVFRYMASHYGERPFLAVLKLDLSEMLVLQVEKEAGRLIVTFRAVENVMPAARERLQKAALVQLPPSEGAPDLLLLDRQTEEVAAEFFARGFLQAEPLLGVRDRTKKLHAALVSAYNQVKGLLNPAQSEDLLLQTEAALRSTRFDLETWLGNLALPEAAKGSVRDRIRRDLRGEVEFALDSVYAREQLVDSLRFQGDFGFKLHVYADHYKDVVREKTDLADGRTRLVLEVRNLHLVKK